MTDIADEIAQRFATALREYRVNQSQQTGETIAEAMRNLGFTTWRVSTLSKVEHREREVKLSEAIALCRILGTRLEWMIETTTDNHDTIGATLRKANRQIHSTFLDAMIHRAAIAETKMANDPECQTIELDHQTAK